MNTRVFQKRHFVKKKKCAPHHATGGYLGTSYPEGGPQKTSLGGPYWHLKLGKYDLAAAVYFINLWFLFHFTIACFITEVKFWAEIRFGGKEEGGHQQCGKLIPPVKRPGEIVWKFVWIECWGECINETAWREQGVRVAVTLRLSLRQVLKIFFFQRP